MGLVAIALKLVVGALGLIDKTVAAHDEASDELKGLQKDLEQLQTQDPYLRGVESVSGQYQGPRLQKTASGVSST